MRGAVAGFCWLAATCVGLSSGAGCVRERCSADRECAAGQYCDTTLGTCRVPECATDGACGTGRICDGHACVPGCRVDGDCLTTERCPRSMPSRSCPAASPMP